MELLLLLRLFLLLLLLLLLPLLLLLLMLQEVCGLGKGDAGPSSCKGYNSGPAILCTSHKIEVTKEDGGETGGGGDGGEPVGDGGGEHVFLAFGVAGGEVGAAQGKVVPPPLDAGSEEAAVRAGGEFLGEADGALL